MESPIWLRWESTMYSYRCEISPDRATVAAMAYDAPEYDYLAQSRNVPDDVMTALAVIVNYLSLLECNNL